MKKQVFRTIFSLRAGFYSGFALIALLLTASCSSGNGPSLSRDRRASLRSYIDIRGKEGLSLELSGSGSGWSGFFSWPERGLYGDVEGKQTGFNAAQFQLYAADRVDRTLVGHFRFFGGLNATLRETENTSTAAPVKVTLQRVPDKDSASAVLKAQAFSARLDVLGRSFDFFDRLRGKAKASDGAGGRLSAQERDAYSPFSTVSLEPRDKALVPAFDQALRGGLRPRVYAEAKLVGMAKDLAELRSLEVPVRQLEFLQRDFPISKVGHYLSVASSDYYYAGGAHGQTTTTCAIFDLKTAKRISFAEVFPQGEKSVEEALRKEALRAMGLQPDDSLTLATFFKDEIVVSQNIFFTQRGVGFQYGQYELAPYSSGIFYFVVPWDELRALLAPEIVSGIAASGIAVSGSSGG